jgi:hypothetical protein
MATVKWAEPTAEKSRRSHETIPITTAQRSYDDHRGVLEGRGYCVQSINYWGRFPSFFVDEFPSNRSSGHINRELTGIRANSAWKSACNQNVNNLRLTILE